MKAICISIIFSLLSLHCLSSPYENLIYTTEEHPPYNFSNGETVEGLSVDLLRLIWRELNIPEQKIQILPWARGLYLLDSTENNVLFTMARTQDRSRKYNLACSDNTSTSYAFIALKKHKIKVTHLDD